MRPTFHALTSLRGLAAWWVVAYHFRDELDPQRWPWFQAVADYGYLSVDLFFIMSGFVIALSYEGSMRNLDRSEIARFLGFRLARIYPLHFAMLIAFLANPLAIALLSSSGNPGDRYDPGYYLQSLLLIQNWGFSSNAGWNVPAWSISTEWGAYLVFPVLAWCAQRFVTNILRTAAVLACMLILLALLGHHAGSLGGDFTHTGLPRCLIEFTIGMAVYRLWSLGSRWYPGADLLFAAALVALAAGSVARLPDYAFAPFGMLLLVLGLLDKAAFGARALSHRALVWVGEISYSTYLVHYFVKDWTKFLLLRPGIPVEFAFACYLAATAAASVLLYRLVELPGREFGRERVAAWLARRQPA